MPKPSNLAHTAGVPAEPPPLPPHWPRDCTGQLLHMPFKDSSGANCTLASGNGSNADTLFVFVPANTLVLKPGDARWLADWIREWDDSRPPDEEPRPDGERGAEFVADELARVDLLEGVLRTCWRHGLDQERALELLAAAGKELAAGRPKEPAGDA